MQIKSKHLLTMLVMAGISASAISAKAATFTAGDLLLAFNQVGGSNTVLTVDLGPVSQFTSGTNIANVASLGSLINSTYGSSALASNDSTLFWSVAGANTSGGTDSSGDPNKTAYLTQAQDASGTINKNGETTSTFVSGVTTRNTYASQIGGDQSSYSNYAGTSPLALPNTNTSWVTHVQNNWGNSSLPYSVQGSFASGPSGTALDLYRILGQSSGNVTSTYEGTFSINSSGVVSYNTTVAAAPEPSRTLFAALGLGGLLLRRRRVNA